MSVLLALFSALGAVLLFLLKLVGILLLIGNTGTPEMQGPVPPPLR